MDIPLPPKTLRLHEDIPRAAAIATRAVIIRLTAFLIFTHSHFPIFRLHPDGLRAWTFRSDIE